MTAKTDRPLPKSQAAAGIGVITGVSTTEPLIIETAKNRGSYVAIFAASGFFSDPGYQSRNME
jgi:hypothetical protein